MAKNNIPYYRYYPCMDQKRYLRHKKTVDTVAIHSTIIATFFNSSNYSISRVFGVYTRMSKCWVQNAEIVWKIALRQGWSHKDLIRFAPALFHGWTNAENHLNAGAITPPGMDYKNYMHRLKTMQRVLRYQHNLHNLLVTAIREILQLQNFFVHVLPHVDTHPPFMVSIPLFLVWFRRQALAWHNDIFFLNFVTFQGKSVWEQLLPSQLLHTFNIAQALKFLHLSEKKYPHNLVLLSRKFNLHYYATCDIAATFIKKTQVRLINPE